jgi:hypothetical protein
VETEHANPPAHGSIIERQLIALEQHEK